MSLRSRLLAAVLFAAGACFVTGAALLHPAAGWITAGAVLALWGYLVFGDIGDVDESSPGDDE